MNYLIYLTPLLFNIAFEFYSKWQFDEAIKISAGTMTYANAPRKWHPYGGFMRFDVFVCISVEHAFPSYWADIFASAVINVILWDVLMNVVVLKVKAFYNGTTAKTDKLGNIKWYSYAVLFVAAVIYKLTQLFNKNKTT
jgi:hypothetical protein